jgi:hypothetical protein
MHLGKFPAVQRALCCIPCSFKKWMFTANSQAGQAYVITDLIITLWRVSLMLALKRLLLNRE